MLSDLHLEITPYTPARVDADVVVLAGDTFAPSRKHPERAVEWAADAYPDQQVVMVAGNHCAWKGGWPRSIEKMRAAAPAHVHVLENESVVLHGTRFLGCTLWTDFDLYRNAAISMLAAGGSAGMNDYKKIRLRRAGTPSSLNSRRLRPADTLKAHVESVAWLRSILRVPFHGPTVVATHHAPSTLSIARDLMSDALTPAYASRLEDLILETQPDLWVHGHTHHCVDYELGDTRVLSNARGYPVAGGPGFDPTLVVELAT